MQTVSLTADTRLQQRRVRHLSSSRPSTTTTTTTSLLVLHPMRKSSSPSASRLTRAPRALVSISSIHPTTHNTPEYTFTLHPSLFASAVPDLQASSTSTLVPRRPHTRLFSFRDVEKTKYEDLDFHVFFDVSVLGVFVNDRVAMTTRCIRRRVAFTGYDSTSAMRDEVFVEIRKVLRV
ncbi:hypothetical protein BKA56DRAFT_369373 [Ilyonectria sp. MPI-CAGE-AT-0026]|nr:hypothetical protein BKA56DRAFT_369373 [Ilyonectria sp. MPI-CAGE-AT-0026]